MPVDPALDLVPSPRCAALAPAPAGAAPTSVRLRLNDFPPPPASGGARSTIQLDEVWPEYPDLDDPHWCVDPWCQCPACSARDREANLQDCVLWLVRLLVDRGVGAVVVWNDQLTRHMDALDSGFAARLREAGPAGDGCAATRQNLVDAMAVMERSLPEWLVPSALMGSSPLLAFPRQLELELRQGLDGRVAAGDVRWTTRWTT